MKNLKMNNQFFALILMLIVLGPAPAISGPTQFITNDKRIVEAYHSLDLEGAFTVTLIQGNEESVVVETPGDIASQVMTKVESGELKVYTEKGFKSSEKVALTITFKNLKSIDCSGAIVLNGKGSFKFEDFSFYASGACKATLEFTAGNLDVDISGAGTATMQGTASKVDLDISGAGKFMAASLAADVYEIDISGTGKAEVNAMKILDVEISGTGNVKYSGEPKITKQISGTGNVTKL